MNEIRPMDVLESLDTLLNVNGKNCAFGCNEDDIDSIKQRSIEDNPDKPIRAVKNWALWDLEVSDAEAAQLNSIGLKPMMIYSTYIIWDRYSPDIIGTSVRSTLLVKFTENCLFETKNTIYILVSRGTRKTVALNLALSIFF